MEKTVQFQMDEFSGPLDLLLALVAKNKMSIYDIEILTLIDQYLEVVGTLSPDDLESASEFISMAARLVQMKSYLLLPKSEEAERIREELTGLLVEYSACKKIAGVMGQMAKGIFIAVREPAEVQLDTIYTGVHVVAELTNAYQLMQGRKAAIHVPKQEHFDELIAAPIVSVASRVLHVLRGLARGRFDNLQQLFRPKETRGELVATFLAVLELVRSGRISLGDEGEISLNKERIKNKRPEEETSWN